MTTEQELRDRRYEAALNARTEGEAMRLINRPLTEFSGADDLARAYVAAQERIAELEEQERRLTDALADARPYVFNRTQAVGHDRGWREETAVGVLARVDAALQNPQASGNPKGGPSHGGEGA